jgi:uncharacterized membrane protein
MVPGAVGAPPPGASWSPGDAWGFAWKVITKRYTTVALPLVVGILVQAILGNIVSGGGSFALTILNEQGLLEPTALPLLNIAVSSFGGLVSVVVAAFMAGGFVNTALKAARGQPTSFGDPFSGGRTFMPMLIAIIVGGIVTMVGLLLCFVPGVIVALGISLNSMLVVDQNLGGVDALKKSWEMTKGHKVNIFLFGLIGLLVFVAGALACGIGALLVSMPMGYVAFAHMYLRIKGESVPEPT